MKYDLAVIGGGPGGYVAAIRAGRLGLKTVLFEKKHLGGTCLNEGCIPTKALLKSAHLHWTMKHAGEHGIEATVETVDFAKTQCRKDSIVSKLRFGIRSLLKNSGVELVEQEARMIDSHTIKAGETLWETENIILAAGSQSVLPANAEGKAITSDHFLELQELPRSVVIVGGGVIGVEFAEMLSGFGCAVTILELADRLVATADPDISAIIQDLLENKGVNIMVGTRVTDYSSKGVRFETKAGIQTLECDSVLVSIGRVPAVHQRELEKLGICFAHGKIKVNEMMETSLPHVYAIGDIVAGPMLAHKASAEGLVAAEAVAGKHAAMRYDRIPQCIYTNPEIAWVGMTALEAEEQEHVKAFSYPIGQNGKAMADGEEAGFVRLIADGNTGEVLGAQLVCAHASDLIGQVLTAMQAEACIEDLADLISPHPSLCESIMEAAAGLCGKGIHIIS